MTDLMNKTFTAVDISKLPKPEVLEQLSFETIYKEMRDQMNGLQPLTFTSEGKVNLVSAQIISADNGEQYFRIPVSSDAGLMYLEHESEPAARQLQIVAYREMLVRQRTNDASLAVMLAYAIGPDLDQIGARYDVVRLLITAAEPANNLAAVYESDEDFRRRIQLSSEEYSTAGPEGAYVYHALSADANVKDASAQSPSFQLAQISADVRATLPANAIVLIVKDDAGLTDPMPGDVAITVLSRTGNGTADNATLTNVDNKLNQDGIRPITDTVRKRSASVTDYTINATLKTYAGPDSSLVISNAEKTCQAYVDENHKLGRDITISGLYGALHQPGVQKVILDNFDTDIICNRSQSAFCTSINIAHGGLAE
jgi:phage-related baseplate assembly protein